MNWILPFTILVCVGWNFSKADEENNLHATMTSLHVMSDIKFRYATTRVAATYINAFNSAVTANFHVTLPARAYISNFSMTVDGNDTYGVVKRKEEAKAIYEEAVAKGQSAGYVGVKHRFTNVYDISVNIEPGKDVVFNLTYQELLERSLGKYRHVIHLINKEIVNDFLVEIFISEPQDIIDIQIPKIESDVQESLSEETQELEEATIEYVDSKNVYIRYNPSPNQQRNYSESGIEGLFKVGYDVDREDNPNTVYAVDGYFVHFFAPDSLPPLPKNIVFMLDVSGSMSHTKLTQLQQAMTTILNSLVFDLDSFLIGYFSNVVHWMNDGVFLPSTKDNIAFAIKEVNALSARGGTNINMALLQSVEKLKSVSSSQKKDMLFFLTDGQPTVGVQDTKIIRENVKKANNDSVSFFMLGFGSYSNIPFLKDVATENGGFARKIYIAADSQLQIEGLYKEISSILLKDLQITYLDEEVEPETLTPTHFSSFFQGSEVVTTGQLNSNDTQELTVQMTMTNSSGTETIQLKFDLIDLNGGNANSPNLTELSSLSEITRNTWVFLTLKKLLNEDRTEENTEEIISLALKYGFVTPLTAMVVVTDDLVRNVPKKEDVGVYADLQGMPPPSIGLHSRIGPSHHNAGPYGMPGYPIGQRSKIRLPYHTTQIMATSTVPMMSPPPTTKIPSTNVTNFIPGIILNMHGCDEPVCLGHHASCVNHTKVVLLADSQAYIYIYGYLSRTSPSNCMEAFRRLVIKKKRKVLAEITPETLTKNDKTISMTDKTKIILNIKKYLRLTVYKKKVDNTSLLMAHFTILKPLPIPTGLLSPYMLSITCRKVDYDTLVLDDQRQDLYKRLSLNSTLIPNPDYCFLKRK